MQNFKKSIYEDLEVNAGSSSLVEEAFVRLNAWIEFIIIIYDYMNYDVDHVDVVMTTYDV